MAKPGKKSSATKRERKERRFEPQSAANPFLVKIVGAIGAGAMGAGMWGQFGAQLTDSGLEPFKYAPYILAAGALVLGFAIWFGTSGEPVLRVGDPGIAVEKGSLRRMPWWAVDTITWEKDAVHVVGKDETDAPLTVHASLKSHGPAASWIVQEARARVPDVLDLSEDAKVPDADPNAGTPMIADPIQVVGRRCAETKKPIAYEPDARVCRKCERIYHRSHVPETCACGADLSALREKPKAS